MSDQPCLFDTEGLCTVHDEWCDRPGALLYRDDSDHVLVSTEAGTVAVSRNPRHDEVTLDDLCPNSGASKGVCGCVSCSNTTASERRILLDLIAELRDVPRSTRTESHGDVHWALPHIDAMHVDELLDRAEARLREVQGE